MWPRSPSSRPSRPEAPCPKSTDHVAASSAASGALAVQPCSPSSPSAVTPHSGGLERAIFVAWMFRTTSSKMSSAAAATVRPARFNTSNSSKTRCEVMARRRERAILQLGAPSPARSSPAICLPVHREASPAEPAPCRAGRRGCGRRRAFSPSRRGFSSPRAVRNGVPPLRYSL
jgi:hypothetical protein